MAGTTVVDEGTVEAAFIRAIRAVGICGDAAEVPGMIDYVRRTMGTSKIDVFTHLLGGDAQRAARANAAFEESYASYLNACRPVEGAESAIDALREHGIAVALTTGFSAHTQDAIIEALGWRDRIDLLLTPGPDIRGRPFPDLPLTAFLRLGGIDVRALAVVGDTVSDVISGRRAGAGIVAGVLTGAHDRDQLQAADPTHILASVQQLPELLLSASRAASWT